MILDCINVFLYGQSIVSNKNIQYKFLNSSLFLPLLIPTYKLDMDEREETV